MKKRKLFFKHFFKQSALCLIIGILFKLFYNEDKKKLKKNSSSLLKNQKNDGLNKKSKASSKTDKNEILFIGNSSSKKFHSISCRWATNISEDNKVIFSSKTEPEDLNYIPCSICKP